MKSLLTLFLMAIIIGGTVDTFDLTIPSQSEPAAFYNGMVIDLRGFTEGNSKYVIVSATKTTLTVRRASTWVCVQDWFRVAWIGLKNATARLWDDITSEGR